VSWRGSEATETHYQTEPAMSYVSRSRQDCGGLTGEYSGPWMLLPANDRLDTRRGEQVLQDAVPAWRCMRICQRVDQISAAGTSDGQWLHA